MEGQEMAGQQGMAYGGQQSSQGQYVQQKMQEKQQKEKMKKGMKIQSKAVKAHKKVYKHSEKMEKKDTSRKRKRSKKEGKLNKKVDKYDLSQQQIQSPVMLDHAPVIHDAPVMPAQARPQLNNHMPPVAFGQHATVPMPMSMPMTMAPVTHEDLAGLEQRLLARFEESLQEQKEEYEEQLGELKEEVDALRARMDRKRKKHSTT
eukprot:TRINITY_DN11633_c0_g1_i1.p1 TRINITY_DN11633_c0_g1~~TRINITY_DN11633_c0_g1_i1.p1  ORF type:complete len:204 (+),score=76.71 TRINITY_DN11633_c0_g1_i1:170-781(+)